MFIHSDKRKRRKMMEGAYFTTNLDGELRYEDERTKSIDGCINMVKGHINILEHITLQDSKKELERLIKFRAAYVKDKMEELRDGEESHASPI